MKPDFLSIPLQNSKNSPQNEFKRLSLRDVVIERMKQAIINGELVDAQKITEFEMAERFGVSRGLIREVIRELENAGIVINIPYRGTFVRALTAERVNELYTLRVILEEYAVELAVKKADDDGILHLRSIIDKMYRYAKASDVNSLVETDLEFHKALYALSHHQMLIDTLEKLSGQTHMFIQASKVIYSLFPSLDEVASSHEPIIDAISNRQVENARNAIHYHISDVGQKLVNILCEKEQIEKNLREISENVSSDASLIPPNHPFF
jgi:DNA-binding GntR family transcriptional regulator